MEYACWRSVEGYSLHFQCQAVQEGWTAYLEDGGSTPKRNVRSYLPIDRA
jgi:hypothetical protein